jgi:hypothetical protein
LDEEGSDGRNSLLYLMEKGAVLYSLGRFRDSIDVFLMASDVMKDLEMIRLSKETASLVTSDLVTDYNGEYAEHLLVHTYLMMNYLMTAAWDDALVEARLAIDILDEHPESCSCDYFTRALAAHCFEAVGDINGAYIEYRKLAELMDDPSPVARKVYLLGKRLGLDEDVAPYQSYLDKSDMALWNSDDLQEVVIFLIRGRAPVKQARSMFIPPSIRFSVPVYVDVSPRFHDPVVTAVGSIARPGIVTTDVSRLLRQSLKARMATIVAKETARVAAKEAIARQVDDDTLETLVRISFFLMEHPDTRCWQTLPASFTLVTIPFIKGELHKILLSSLGGGIDSVALPDIDADDSNRRFIYYAVGRMGQVFSQEIHWKDKEMNKSGDWHD